VAGDPEIIKRIQPDSNLVYATAHQPLLIRVQVTDRWDNPIGTTPVTFFVKKPDTNKGVLVDAQGEEIESLTITSDDQGFAEVLFKPAITTVSVNQVEISVDRGPNQQPIYAWVNVVGQAPAAKRMQIMSSKSITVQANALVDVEVAAFDAVTGGNRVPNHTISFTVESGDGMVLSSGNTFGTRQTGSDGSNARETWNVGPQTGRAVLVINGGETLAGSPDSVIATVQPAAPFADSSKIKVMSALTAGIQSLVQISLTDQFGNPISGREFTLTSPDNHVSFEQPTAATDVSGKTYGSVTATKAGAIRIGAVMKSDDSFRIPEITTTVAHGAAATLELMPGQTNQFVGNIGAILKSPLMVRVTDAFDNIVSAGSAEVKFTLVAGSGAIKAPNASQKNAFITTDSLGRCQIQLKIGTAVAEPHIVEASLSDPNKPDVKLTFTGQSRRPVLPYSLTKVSGDSAQGQVGETLPEPLVVKVTDKDGLPVWSENNPLVRFTSLIGAGEFVDGEYKSSDYLGRASVRYAFITGGSHSIKAFIPTGDTQVIFTAFAQAGSPAALLPVESVTQEFVVNSQVSSIKVMVTDEEGNPVNDVPVRFNLADEPLQEHGAAVDNEPVLTGASGQPGVAQANVKLGEKAGQYFIEAYSEELPADEKVLFQISATPADAFYLSKYAGDQQFGTKNRTLVYPVIVKVMDEFLNPVPGVTVEFWANSTQGNGQPTNATAMTSANGLAETWWQLGNKDQCELYVQKLGLRPWPDGAQNTFVAFGVDNSFPEFKNMPAEKNIFTKNDFVLPLYAEDGDDDPLTFQITSGLPGGAVFDPVNAVIRWTPAQTGQWTIHYRVDDNKPAPERGFDVDSIKITVATKVEIFSSYPQESFIRVPYDGEQEFGIVATGTNLTYEWILNDEVVPNANQSRFIIKASDYPRGAVHSLKGIAYDATNAQNRDQRQWGLRTKVELASFEGASLPFEGVELTWTTSHEDGNIGFDVLRSAAKNGTYAKVTDTFIQSRTGRYSFTDTTAVAGRTYFYKLEDFDIGGLRSQSEAIMVTVDVPKDFMLLQNYPNPFNPVTTIRFQLPKATDAKVAIFNIQGQLVKTMVDGHKDAGYYEMRWHGQNEYGVSVSSGVYYYRIRAGDFEATKKMLLIR
jgi:hypothetical protein